MSTCRNRVVWFTARLPSSALRSRICPGQWHRDAAIWGIWRTRRNNYSTSASLAASPAGAGDRDGSSGPRTAFSHALYTERTDRGDSSSTVRSSSSGYTDTDELKDNSGESPSGLTTPTAVHAAANGTETSPPSFSKVKVLTRRCYPSLKRRIRVLYQYRDRGKRHPVPRRVAAAINGAQNSLARQGRVISPSSFRRDIEIRLSSLFAIVSSPKGWKFAYGSLYAAKARQEEWRVPEWMELDRLGYRLVDMLENEGRESFQRDWESLTLGVKRFQWPRLALWWLQNSPKFALEFLLATNNPPYPPFSMVVHCMIYIKKFCNTDENLYRSVVSTCMDPERWPAVVVSQRGVRLYLNFSSLDKVSRAFALMRKWDIEMSPVTALCFMKYFTEGRDINRAIEALRLIPLLNVPGFELDSVPVMRHCCKLLTLDTVQEKDGVRNFRILPKLLELGVRPNLHMMNVVLLNAFKSGDPQLGEDMLKYMKDNDMELDSYTYLTLLSDAVARGDRARVEEVMREIDPNEELRKNPYIVSKIFHAHFTFTAKRVDSYADPAGIFLSMLDLYSRYYDLAPLKDLQLIPPSFAPIERGADAEPSCVALYIMLATYLRSKKNSDRAYRLYRRFRQLVMEGHKTIAPLAEFEQFPNEFIVAFREDPHALRYCVEVVEDMLHPDPGVVTAEGRKVTPAKPTVWTWNILLSAFIFHRQLQAAEKVKEMMRKHGVEYDQTTYNTIINGYANAQDIHETVATIKEMESHGYKIDSYTIRPLRFLRDPERLGAALDELDQKTAEQARWEQEVEEKEREELLEQGLRRLAAAKREGKS